MKNCIKNTAKSSYFKNFGMKTSIACIYGIIVLAVLALAFFFWPSLILTIPLLVLPFTFSFLACNAAANQKQASIANFFKFYPIYFRHMFHGGFRGWHALLKCLIVFLAATTIGVIVITIIATTNPELKSIFDQMSAASTTDKFNELFQKFINHPYMSLMTFVEIQVSVGVTFYVLFHHIFTHSPKMYFSLYSKEPLPMKDIVSVHRFSFRTFRKPFYKEYYSSLWINSLLYVIGYSGAVTIAYYAFANNGITVNEFSVSILGLAGAFIINLFVLPFTFDVIEQLYREHKKDYALGFIDFSHKVINSEIGQKEISEQQRKALEEILNRERDEVLKNFDKKEKKGDDPEDKEK